MNVSSMVCIEELSRVARILNSIVVSIQRSRKTVFETIRTRKEVLTTQRFKGDNGNSVASKGRSYKLPMACNDQLQSQKRAPLQSALEKPQRYASNCGKSDGLIWVQLGFESRQNIQDNFEW